GGAERSAQAPTVMACVAAPGEPTLAGMSPELPAATTTTTLPATAALAAWLSASLPSEAASEPRLIEMRFTPCETHQSMPAMTWLSGPDPLASSTLAAWIATPGATPR